MDNTLFISDLHLDANQPDIHQRFLEFISTQNNHTKTLYILGDLFEYWIGDDACSPYQEEVQQTLAELTQRDITCYIMHGNRDFLLGQQFLQETGCQFLADPSIINLYGRKCLLTHGDSFCIDDTDYMAFRKQVRNPQWQAMFLAKSIEERILMAKQARDESMAATKNKATEIMDVNLDAVKQCFIENDVDYIIHGHTHRPYIHEYKIKNSTKKRIVLGDWYNQESLLLCNDKDFQLIYNSKTSVIT